MFVMFWVCIVRFHVLFYVYMATYLVVFWDVYSHTFCSGLGMFCQMSGVALGMYGNIYLVLFRFCILIF